MVSSDQVNQQLILGREPQSTVSFSNINGGSFVTPQWKDKSGGDWGSSVDPDNKNRGLDSKLSYTFHANGEFEGVVMVATYTDLHNSYYTDANGVKHHITKIVRTFSNLKKSDGQLIKWIEANPETPASVVNNYNPSLVIYSDPTDGFWYTFANSIQVSDKYYDENGNEILFDNNSAFLAITSLNNEFPKSLTNQSTEINNRHIESVTVNNGKALALAGSSITVHGKSLYSSYNNSEGQGLNDAGSWDSRSSKNQYYGTGLVELDGDGDDLTFYTQRNDDATPSVWVTMTTIIPQTPTPRAIVSYHHDVTHAKK